eukprot:7291615-Prymnesium_polylepis.1
MPRSALLENVVLSCSTTPCAACRDISPASGAVSTLAPPERWARPESQSQSIALPIAYCNTGFSVSLELGVS